MKRVIFAILVIVITATAQAKYSGGSGEPNDPYQIADVNDLLTLANDINDYNKCFIQTSDIDLDPNLPGNQIFTTAVIAPDKNNDNYVFDGISFSGIFDGAGHKIVNMTIHTGGVEYDYLGFFGSVDGNVGNLHICDFSIYGFSLAGDVFCVGGLVGYNHGRISECSATGAIYSGGYGVYGGGGLAGINAIDGAMEYCWSNCTVNGFMATGGLAGQNAGTITSSYASGNAYGWSDGIYPGGCGGLVGENSGTITACYSTGLVEHDFGGAILWPKNATGGLVGYNEGQISRSFATGPVESFDCYCGGLIGYSYGGNVSECYAAGSVDLNGYADTTGGLIAEIDGATVTNSFWDINTTGQSTSAGGTGKTTVQMMQSNTFIPYGWDFATEYGPDDIWIMREGIEYPQFVYMLCEPNYGGGNGTVENPYLLHTAGHLIGLGTHPNDWNKHFALSADINMANYYYRNAVIAPYTGDENDVFTGTFDGNGFLVKNLTLNRPDYPLTGDYLGLFGRIAGDAKVIKLGLVDVNVQSTMLSSYAGALAGENAGGNISQCFSTGLVKTVRYRGGLVGGNYSGTITDCYSDCAIESGYTKAATYAGGLVGSNLTVFSFINNCFSTGSVSGGSALGGLVGENNGTVTFSFWDVNTSGQSTSAGGAGKTTVEMKTKSTFTDAGWDFVWETINGPNDVWAICQGVSYPKLSWQYVIGDSDSDKDVDFIDFAPFGNKWMQADSTLYCGGQDLTGDEFVNLDDLAVFTENWLEGL